MTRTKNLDTPPAKESLHLNLTSIHLDVESNSIGRFDTARSMMSAESCSKYYPESPRSSHRVMEGDHLKNSPSSAEAVRPGTLHPRQSSDNPSSYKGATITGDQKSSKSRGHDCSHETPLKMAVKRTSSDQLKIRLGHPKPDHGLKVEPWPRVPHPSEWSNRHIKVFMQQVYTAHPERPKDLPLLNSTRIFPGELIKIDNALFKGIALIRLRGLGGADDDYFRGKKRRHQCVVQGKFKKQFRADEIWGGQIFAHAWRNMPSSWAIRGAMTTIKMLNPSLCERITSSTNPFVLFPWISTPQRLHITPRGKQPPDIFASSGLTENCLLLGQAFHAKDSSFRRRYFSDYTKLKNIYFERDLTYTFEDFQDAFDFNSCHLNVKLGTLDIAFRLHDMPLEMGVMHFKPSSLNKNIVEDEFEALNSVSYLWRFQLWPKDCVTHRFYGESGKQTAAKPKHMSKVNSFSKSAWKR